VEGLGEEMVVEVARLRRCSGRGWSWAGRPDRLLMNGFGGDLVRAAKIMYDVLGIQFAILDLPKE
jgi:hypothetical protein